MRTSELSERIFELEDRYELAKKASGFGVWDWNIEKGTLDWDADMHKLFGTNPDEWRRTYGNFAEQLKPDELAECERRIGDSIRNRTPYRYRFTAKNGRLIYGLGKVYYRGEDAVRMVGVCIPAFDANANL